MKKIFVCPKCSGTKKVEDKPCPTCDGSGVILKEDFAKAGDSFTKAG